jgi:hypothetical protein
MSQTTEEAIHPTVRSILDDVFVEQDGPCYVDRYVHWVMTLRGLPAKENARVFVQLAVLARQYSEAGCRPVALSLASLARIGLSRRAKP